MEKNGTRPSSVEGERSSIDTATGPFSGTSVMAKAADNFRDGVTLIK